MRVLHVGGWGTLLMKPGFVSSFLVFRYGKTESGETAALVSSDVLFQ